MLNDGMPKVINLSLAGRDQDRNTQWAWLFQTGDEDSQQWGFGPRNLEFREYVTSTNNSSEYRRRFVIESSYGETANVNELPSLYLTSDSKLGIGSGEPTATLDVQNRTDTPGFTGRRDLANFANWKNNAMTISMFGSGHPVTPNTVQLGAWNNQSIAIVSDTKAKVQAGGSTKGLFVQRVSGNVGIKTNDPKEALQIGNNFTFHSGGNKVISYNSYYKVGENVSRRISNGPASSIFFTNNGSVGIRTANNSTKDSQVNWKSRLVVNNDGSVCIGNC
jgi:hypothetical protein